MLYVFYGNDTVAVRRKAMTTIDELTAKGYTLARYTAEEYAPGLMLNLLQTDSLFDTKEVVVLDTPSENAEYAEEVAAVSAELHASVIPFVVIEQVLLAPQVRAFTKVGAVVQEAKKTGTTRFNTFLMADALLARDKKTLWILLQEAHMKEVASEEIIGVLWWQLKILRLTYVTSTASEAGVKDFPYNKAKRAHSKFTQTDADRLSRTLLAVYHDSHSGRRDMTSALEEWVLKI